MNQFSKKTFVLSSLDFIENLLPDFLHKLNEIICDNSEEDHTLISITDDYNQCINSDFFKGIEVVSVKRRTFDYKIDGTVSLKELVNGIPVPIFLKNTNGQFIGCNPSFTRLFGFEEYDLIGKTSYDVSPKEEADEYFLRDKEIIKHQGIQVYEGTITNKFGKEHKAIFRKSILKDSEDNIVAIVGVIIDITKRKNIEKSLWDYRTKLQEMVLEKTSDLSKKNQLLEAEIEKRKKSEEDLLQQEYLLRTILNSTYDAIIVFKTDGYIVSVNNKMLEMFDLKIENIPEINYFSDLSSEDNDLNDLKDRWNKIINEEEQFFEWYAKKPLVNEKFVAEIFLRKIFLNHRTHILANIRDISERKKSEIMFLQEHNKVKIALKHEMLISTVATVLNSSDGFYCVIDSVLNIISSTLGIKDVQFIPLDYSENLNIINKKWLNYAFSEDSQYNIYPDSQEIKHLTTSIMSKITKSISIFWSDLTETIEVNRKILSYFSIKSFAVIPLRNQLNKSSGTVSKVSGILVFESEKSNEWTSKHYSLFNTLANMVSNSWERYIQTKARLEAEMKIAESVHLLENSSRLASIGVMAAGITHEINQPLNAIKVTADSFLFQNKRIPGLYPENLIKKIGNISSAADRIDDIIKHMRSFWAPDDKTKEQIFEIHEAICQAISILNKQMSLHNIELRLTFLRNYPTIDILKDLITIPMYISGKRIHFEQIIINLLVNASHALDSSKKESKFIRIDTEIDNNYFIVRVTDNGMGLPESFFDKLFDPFFSTKKPGEGMGLGLAIVKFFMDSFNGKIKAYNVKEFDGACFELFFLRNSKKEIDLNQ